MTDTFTASNGGTIDIDAGALKVACSGNAHPSGHHLSPSETQTLREFFCAERDEELGRWRWPENPRYVVYPMEGDGQFRVMDETTGDTWTYVWSAIKDDPQFDGPWDAARAYFEAHPERKPWHDAKPGEVWILTTAVGHERAVVVGDDGVLSVNGAPVALSRFESGRRIWPEDAS